MSSPKKNTALLSLRTTVVLMCALLIGVIVGALTYLGAHPTNVAQAVIVGLAALGASALGLNQLIDT